ncbi:hypothetical protein K7957_18250 [Sphingomonas yunnanensis]|uniref:hypothetical protein n=1 Tax=Sphingomonas yunnanensis TaxID=310400 RepID=UPI001CA5F7E5|nr:hypothetical protein [Sphingomonas yunnanensis]MBY9064881.1 hypothetical protein [Sphingomonas yunnanensis]
MKVVPILALSTIALAGCSNSKEANKSNFEHAINEWIEKGPPCLDVPDGTVTAPGQKYNALPAYVEATPKAQPFAEESRQRRLAPLEALVDAGLMKKTTTVIEQENMFGGAERKVAVLAYDFTSEGKAAFEDDARPSVMGGKRSGLCYGKPHVDEITNFTQPADMMGMTLSQVSYKYHLADLPGWAKNQKMKAAFPNLARNTAESLDAKAAVILTNDGWKHEKAI